MSHICHYFHTTPPKINVGWTEQDLQRSANIVYGGRGDRKKSLQINFHDCLKMKKKINKELGIFWN